MEFIQKLRHPAFRSEIVHQEFRGMASRPVWEGHLRLSLVACPVRLFKATGEGNAVHFHLLHRQTLNRVRQQYRDPEDGVVERKDMVKGYEISFAPLTPIRNRGRSQGAVGRSGRRSGLTNQV